MQAEAGAEVWAARVRDKKSPCCVKRIALKGYAGEMQDLQREASIIRMCEHPSIVACLDVFVHPCSTKLQEGEIVAHVVMESCMCDLRAEIKRCRQQARLGVNI